MRPPSLVLALVVFLYYILKYEWHKVFCQIIKDKSKGGNYEQVFGGC